MMISIQNVNHKIIVCIYEGTIFPNFDRYKDRNDWMFKMSYKETLLNA